jgi:Zn ribbon nucleic-acid-binding protein
MSGSSYYSQCPMCGGQMDCYADWKPYDIVSANCLNCGFEYYTVEGQLSLEEVNSIRADYELEPLAQLAAQVRG